MTPARQAVIILWEANNQYRGSDGILRSIPLGGENIEDKIQKVIDDSFKNLAKYVNAVSYTHLTLPTKA